MTDRKSLIEGMKTEGAIDPSREKEFVYGDPPRGSPAPLPPPLAPETPDAKAQTRRTVTRVPLTTRIRGDYAAALKRASLERQISGEKPNTLQDILEEALYPWLQAKGYLTPPHP